MKLSTFGRGRNLLCLRLPAVLEVVRAKRGFDGQIGKLGNWEIGKLVLITNLPIYQSTNLPIYRFTD